MGHKHSCDDFDYVDSYTDACGDPDPCSERWARDRARERRAKRQGATVALIVAGVAAVAALAFFLVASGIVVFDNGNVEIGDGNNNDGGNNGGANDGNVVINTDKIGISTDKIIVKKDKHHNND